jgi:hypothetical protein
MSFFIPWLADAARLTGYPVVEIAGWRGHGHGGMRVVEGVTDHHTADGPSGNYPSLNIVRNGRAGLAGPLSQLGLGRDGTVYVIASGTTWHAGSSQWAGFRDLNDEFIGIEAESTGTRDDWTAAQRDCYPRLNAALCFFMRRGADRVAGHKEICIPAGRKIDPAFWDMNQMRGKVAWYLQDPTGRIPRFKTPGDSAPTALPIAALNGEDDMYIKFQARKQDPVSTAILSGGMFVALADAGEIASADAAIGKGAIVQWVTKPTWDDLDRRSHSLCDSPKRVQVIS